MTNPIKEALPSYHYQQVLNVIKGQTLYDSNREALSPREHGAIVSALEAALTNASEGGDVLAEIVQQLETGEDFVYISKRGSFKYSTKTLPDGFVAVQKDHIEILFDQINCCYERIDHNPVEVAIFKDIKADMIAAANGKGE